MLKTKSWNTHGLTVAGGNKKKNPKQKNPKKQTIIFLIKFKNVSWNISFLDLKRKLITLQQTNIWPI